VIAHIVLFKPRLDLTAAEREVFAKSFERALTRIPVVRRARVGQRRSIGRLYDQRNANDYPYVAIIEFDSEADLRTYLEHPDHQDLGRQFYEVAETAMVCDFELSEGPSVGKVLRG
jgi:Stress responsive A/B Barrel Domain